MGGGDLTGAEVRVLNSECGMWKEKKRTEGRRQMKEGERVRRWEGE